MERASSYPPTRRGANAVPGRRARGRAGEGTHRTESPISPHTKGKIPLRSPSCSAPYADHCNASAAPPPPWPPALVAAAGVNPPSGERSPTPATAVVSLPAATHCAAPRGDGCGGVSPSCCSSGLSDEQRSGVPSPRTPPGEDADETAVDGEDVERCAHRPRADVYDLRAWMERLRRQVISGCKRTPAWDGAFTPRNDTSDGGVPQQECFQGALG